MVNAYLSLLCIAVWSTNPVVSEHDSAFEITIANYDSLLKKYDIILVNFYVNWCPHSKRLEPVFEGVAKQVAVSEAGKNNRLAMFFINCVVENTLCEKLNIRKYPTLKLYRFQHMGKEYRGSRSDQDLLAYVHKQLEDGIVYDVTQQYKDLKFRYSSNKRYILAYISTNATHPNPHFEAFKKVAAIFQDDCEFIQSSSMGENNTEEHGKHPEAIVYHLGESADAANYTGDVTDFEELRKWAAEMCQPIVQELTFNNAEELYETGLPFVILFHQPRDKQTPSQFRIVVRKYLQHHTKKVNFLTADSEIFAYPLLSYGKSEEDLPIIAIDTFAHVFVYPNSVKEALNNTELLSQFLEDLYSDKLHQLFHKPPAEPDVPNEPGVKNSDSPSSSVHEDSSTRPEDSEASSTSQVESAFRKLAPSYHRYSFREERDEL